jgi:hypothetical protein
MTQLMLDVRDIGNQLRFEFAFISLACCDNHQLPMVALSAIFKKFLNMAPGGCRRVDPRAFGSIGCGPR